MAEEQKKEKKEGRIAKFLREFKEFISKGNILDLAVGVILGAAFGKIVTSLTNDIIMPLITLAMGKNSIAELSVELRPAVLDETGAVIQEALTWNWGNFLQTIIDFLIIALVVFLMIKLMMGLKKVSEKAQEGARELADKVMGKDEAEEGAADAENAEVAASDAEKTK